jgi:predicted nucleotidyltransferase
VRRDDPNREYLLVVADAIGNLCNEIVFVGGSVAGLLLTDLIADGIRATKDVDAVVEATTLSQYHQVEKRLSVSGFKRDAGSEVICRWRHTGTGVLFDLMPTDPGVLGFSNRWYPEAMKTAMRMRLSDRIEIRVISGPAFVATKLEAFMSRGGGDILSSHDLEDILNVVDGRPSIVEEVSAASEALQMFVRENFKALLSRSDLENYLPGLLTDENRTEIVLSRLERMAE